MSQVDKPNATQRYHRSDGNLGRYTAVQRNPRVCGGTLAKEMSMQKHASDYRSFVHTVHISMHYATSTTANYPGQGLQLFKSS